MQRRSWLAITLAMLALTGFTVARLKKDGPPGKHRVAHVRASWQELYDSAPGSRFRNSQTRHWKYLLLKH